MRPILLLLCFFALAQNLLLSQTNSGNLSYPQLDSLVDAYYNNDDIENLALYAQAAGEKARTSFGKQDTLYAKMLTLSGYANLQLSEWDKSEAALKQALDLYRAAKIKTHYYPAVLYNLGNLYFSIGQFSLSESYLKEALTLAKESNDKEDIANNSNLLGSLYSQMGRMKEAEPLLKEVVRLFLKNKDKEPEKYAGSLINLAGLYADMGFFNNAEKVYLEGISILENTALTKHPFYMNGINNLAVLYLNINRFDESELFFKKGLTLTEKTEGKNSAIYASRLCNLAVLYNNTDRYADAQSLYEEALSIQKQSIGIKHPDYLLTLSNLASLHSEMDNYKKSEQLLKEINALRKEVLGTKDPEYALGLKSLATVYRNTERYPEAFNLLKEAANIYKSTRGVNSLKYIDCQFDLAQILVFEKKYTEALSLLKQTTEGYKETSGARSTGYILAILEQAKVYQEMGDIENAKQLCFQAMETNAALSFKDKPDWQNMLKAADYVSIELMVLSLEQFHDLTQEANKRIEIADLALVLLKQNRDLLINESDKLLILKNTNSWVLRNLNNLDLKKQAEQAFLIAEQSKSALLLDAVQNEAAYTFGDLPDSLVYEERYLQQTLASLQAALLEKNNAETKDSIRSLKNECSLQLDQFQKKITQKYPQYTALKLGSKETTGKEIQALLDKETAMLEYVVGDSILYVIYLDQKNINIYTHKIYKDSLKAQIRKLHNALSDYDLVNKNKEEAYLNYTNSAYWMYQNILSEALKNKVGIKKLIIIPDDELGHLPFEAFLTKKPVANTAYHKLAYLVNDYTISYNYAAALWKENLKRTSNKNNGQIFGIAANYASKLDNNKQSLRSSTYQNLRNVLSPLPAARQEVETLSKNFSGYFAFDALASEQEFKAKAGKFSIIHLAMHGLLDKKNPLLSSLAFTEDGDSTENNFLQAYEISKMKLNADLVVLSACETGYGKFEQGNGTASLARAFMYAGVSSLVVSLWQVNDASTSTIMQLFYKNLAKGMDKAAALRQAKIDYIGSNTAAHPAYWAAFIQIGDSRPIKIASKNSSLLYWAIGAISLLALGGAVYALRRKK